MPHAKLRGMGKWHVYILECADGTLYTGIAIDLDDRLTKHNDGVASKYTRSRLPVKLVYRENVPDRSAALRREAEIKAPSRQQKSILISVQAESNISSLRSQ